MHEPQVLQAMAWIPGLVLLFECTQRQLTRRQVSAAMSLVWSDDIVLSSSCCRVSHVFTEHVRPDYVRKLIYCSNESISELTQLLPRLVDQESRLASFLIGLGQVILQHSKEEDRLAV
jgi:hypothetical protein